MLTFLKCIIPTARPLQTDNGIFPQALVQFLCTELCVCLTGIANSLDCCVQTEAHKWHHSLGLVLLSIQELGLNGS